jgi:hypothetical protein
VSRRPLSVTVVGWLFVAAGVVGLAYHATQLGQRQVPDQAAAWTLVLRFMAVVSGTFILRGANWARWLALAWMAYHVVLSAWHSFSQTAIHAVLLAAIAYALLQPAAAAYFRALGHDSMPDSAAP